MANQSPLNGYVLGLDVGSKRIGVAITSVFARLPQPLAMIPAGPRAVIAIQNLIKTENVTMVVVGLPRNMQGAETAQTTSIRDFAKHLSKVISVPLVFADESLSSVRAEELSHHNQFKNVSQDSIAACFILEEFFTTINQKENI